MKKTNILEKIIPKFILIQAKNNLLSNQLSNKKMNFFRYKEIKYLSHILRNFYIYFILFLAYFLLYDFRLSYAVFFGGLLVFVISYSVVYFLNDYVDRKEDGLMGKNNLYLDIKNKTTYWSLAVFLAILGMAFTYRTSPTLLVILLTLYLLNYLYSFRPFRLKDINFAREMDIFLIYFIKWFLISGYLGFQYGLRDIPFFVAASACASLSNSLYKRHLGSQKLSEYFFGSVFVISIIAAAFIDSRVLIIFLPLALVPAYLSLKYKDTQIPIGKYQAIYFLYTIIVFIVILLLRANR